MANEFKIKNGLIISGSSLIISGSLPVQSSEDTILTIDSSGVVGTKEGGVVGPQGNQGNQGPTGAQGPQGNKIFFFQDFLAKNHAAARRAHPEAMAQRR